mmetsp:Transcript_21620/g.47524  ORF Transcript_21620/g.47524 Transcript_21620/m.47524 type:complete len:171 (-) Transcript_21620:124-636(-)
MNDVNISPALWNALVAVMGWVALLVLFGPLEGHAVTKLMDAAEEPVLERLLKIARSLAPDFAVLCGVLVLVTQWQQPWSPSLATFQPFAIARREDYHSKQGEWCCNLDTPKKSSEQGDGTQRTPRRRRIRRSLRPRKRKVPFDDRVIKSVRFIFEGWPDSPAPDSDAEKA